MKKEHSRRKFLIRSSKIVATVIGVATIGNLFSVIPSKVNVIMKKSISQKKYNILIAYDSQFGSTAEIADFIGKQLSGSEQIVDVKKINEVNDLSIYTHIIIGSAIQYDSWMSEAKDFVIQNEEELSTKSISFFLVCLVLSKKTEKAILQANNYAKIIESTVPKIKIDSFGKFAGVLNYSKMSFLQRILAKGIFAFIGIKEGDYRNWDIIKKWTKNIPLS